MHLRSAIVLCLAIPVVVLETGAIETRRGVAKNDRSREGLLNDPLYAGRRLSVWIKLLESDNPDLRLAAARSLGDMGAEAKGAVPWLIKSLSERDEFIRSAAAWSLGRIGPDAASAVPAMVEAFKRSSGFHKGIIGPAIGHIGTRAVPALVELTKISKHYSRWEAVRALRIAAPGATEDAAEARLIELLSDQEPDIRVEAAFALWKIRPRRSAIDALARALDDPYEFARACAADDLAEIGPDAAPALPGLIRALEDQSDSVRGRSTNALGKIGPRAKVAIPALLRSASHPGQWSSLNQAIKGIGPDAVPALIDGLEDPAIRATAADGLGLFGAVAEAAAPRIRALMNAAHGEARVTFARALWRIRRDPGVVSVLIGLVHDDDFIVQQRAFGALEELGPMARAAIPTLIEMLGHKNQFNRSGAAKVLGAIGPEAENAVPALEFALRDPETLNRIEAAKALWRIAHAEAALTTLSREASNVADSANTFAVCALGEIGPEARASVPALIEALDDDSIFGQAIVAGAIGRIGPEARAAVPRLIEVHNDLYNTERASFADVIKALDPDAAARAGVR